MWNRFGFVVWMHVFALFAWIGVLNFGYEWWHELDFKWHAVSATIHSDDARIAKAFKFKQLDGLRANVVYQSSTGQQSVQDQYIRTKDVAVLANGQGVPVVFHSQHPHRVQYNDEAQRSSVLSFWGMLLVGVLMSAFARYTHRLYVKERDGE